MRPTLGPAAAAAGLHALLLAAYVAAFHGDPSALVCVGRDRAGRAPFEAVRVGIDRDGYDGQFYYLLARNPWRTHVAGIDCAPVRQARILYPAVSYLLSGGDPRLLLWVMPLVNLVAIAALAALGAGLAARQGLSPWWGVLLPLAVNAGLPALRNLTDVLSTLAVCGLLVSWLARGPRPTPGDGWALALWGMAAVFCREQNALIVLLVLLAALRRRDLRTCAGLAATLGLWLVWVVLLREMYGRWPLLSAEGHMGRPLAGMLFAWSRLDLAHVRGHTLVNALGLLVVAAEVGLALWVVRLRVDPVVAVVALAGAALAVVGGRCIYEDHWSYMRVLAWLPLGVWLACVQARRRWPLLLLSVPALLPLAAVLGAWARRA